MLEGNLLGDKITNIVFDVDVFFGNAALNKIRLIAPGNTSITLQGVVTHNAIRSKFDGSLFVASDDLSLLKSWLKVNTNSLKDSKKLLLLSDIAFLANRIKLDNAKAAIDKTTMFGRATFMNDFHKNLEINSSLKFASLDADALSLDKLFDNAIKVLYTSDPDKTSQTYFELVNDHAELRGLNKTVNLEIASDNVIFKKQKFDNFNIALLAKPNFFAIQNMSATSPFLDFTADMALTIPTFKPQLSFNFYAKNCDISYVSKLFPSYTTLQTDLIKYYNDQKNNDQQKNSLIIDFNFLGAQNYNAKLNFKFDTLVYNPSVRINNINSDIVIQDGNISTYNTTAELFNGKLNASGYINVNEAVPSFALSFSLDNILPELFFSPFLNYKNIRGYMSISTSLKTLGINWQDFFSKLSGDIIVVGKQISWDSIDLNEVVKAVNMRLTPEDKLKRIDYYLANGTSFFDDLSGKFSVVNGTATTSNIVLSNGRLQGIYAASYNIASNTISTASKFAFLPIGYPNPLTIQIKSKGNIGSTKTDIDISQLSDFIMAQEKYNADKQTSNKIESSIRTLIK